MSPRRRPRNGARRRNSGNKIRRNTPKVVQKPKVKLISALMARFTAKGYW